MPALRIVTYYFRIINVCITLIHQRTLKDNRLTELLVLIDGLLLQCSAHVLVELRQVAATVHVHHPVALRRLATCTQHVYNI